MDSREFATLIIKHGGDKTMIIIIKEMKDKQYTIPTLLLNKINSICVYDSNYILDEFYKSKNIYNKREMEMCNLDELYSEFKYFIKKNFPKEKIAVVGFSAGGVAAVWTVINDSSAYALAAAHSGAILDLSNVPQSKFNKMSIVMAHGKKDDVFGYEERFVPSIETLRNKGYSVAKITNPNGKHEIDADDADSIQAMLKFTCI